MVHKFDIWFSPAGENRRIHLYLPDEYGWSQERYPVLYMFDGHNLFFDGDATFGKSLGLKDFLDHWGKKLIVVGMECSKEDLRRVHEYCPYHIHSQIYGDVDGRGAATMDWIVHDLKPYIDGTYRSWPHREATAIAGYSMGGMMALFGVLRYNQCFSKAAVISPSIVPAMDSFRQEVRAPIEADTRVFFSWGTGEYDLGYNELVANSIRELDTEFSSMGPGPICTASPAGSITRGAGPGRSPPGWNFYGIEEAST